MDSTNAEALGLPVNAPPFADDRLLGEPAMFLIFHTASLYGTARDRLARLVNSGDACPPNSRLAPLADFSGRSLRAVYDYFLTLREQEDTVQPMYFIVADRVNFEEEGVLVVCLDCSQEGNYDIGVARCETDKARVWGSDLHYGFATWEELKGITSTDEQDDDDVVDPEQKHAKDAAKYGWDVRTYSVQSKTIYGWYSLVEKAVPINRMLDPMWLDKTPEQCRFQMLGNYHASQDPWTDIWKEHPHQAGNRPRVRRSIVLVAEKEDANEEDGVAIVRLKADRPPKVLARVSAGKAIVEADALSS
ncbi:hypothetical protein C7974DRAFT_167381 [Boeremia exigua]|uniref:uncharacterized protein n=1 Tax=Boeremia exigua TaxID=749465 RepID=UPI001E8EA344|nr:uncharacterized protein C7974DRAFT_167381 [Boeremia exigua]KAH6633200.1 hypothetical protein C7974DRAFT_167381 [Boeremia exigua]